MAIPRLENLNHSVFLMDEDLAMREDAKLATSLLNFPGDHVYRRENVYILCDCTNKNSNLSGYQRQHSCKACYQQRYQF